MSLWSRISNALHSERLNREISEELQSHIEEAIASGRDPYEARRSFGSILRQRERATAFALQGGLSLSSPIRIAAGGSPAAARSRPLPPCFRSPSASAPVSPPSVLLTPCSGARCLSPTPATSTSSPTR